MKELIIDSFAGGGGASLGISKALNREVDVAINHDEHAIHMHAANHPKTRHFTEDVWKVNPHKVLAGSPIGLLWASPDCKHFSRAKGSKPVEKKIRSLAWVVIRWASIPLKQRPRIIMLENVREFEGWGPLVPQWICACGWKGTEGQAILARKGHRRACPRCDERKLKETDELIPCPARVGLTFRRFTGRLKNLGYKVEHKVLDAADYGAPTHRKRLFLIARRDGKPIVWPEPTHCDPKKLGENDLFSQMKPWKTAAECLDWDLPCPSVFDRKKPLADKTMDRIAAGIKRYVMTGEPSVVGVGGRMGQSNDAPVGQPMNTVTAKNDRAVAVPIISPLTHDNPAVSPADPLQTITGSGEKALVSPVLIQMGYGEREGQEPRVLDLNQPMGTVVSGGNKQALVAAFIAKHFGGQVGVKADTPLPTTTERGTQNQVVAANLIHLNHGGKQVADLADPLRTQVAGGNHAFLVYSFLTKYFGTSIGESLSGPMGTVTSKEHLGLVIVTIKGEPYVIVDIGMRMLTPRELARGQGFPESYILTGTKTSQVARIGNSVCPVMSEALVKANY